MFLLAAGGGGGVKYKKTRIAGGKGKKLIGVLNRLTKKLDSSGNW